MKSIDFFFFFWGGVVGGVEANKLRYLTKVSNLCPMRPIVIKIIKDKRMIEYNINRHADML